ncbi:MAG TPA: C25 family cysteine peptidase [Pyrinomonadaceae bacterium]|nr:C25 family cysteine peptidase [Pyrinomonadaceae bacterium]
MKKGLVFLFISILVLNSSVFAQNLRSFDTKRQNPIVTYAGSRAFSDGRGVWLEWQTASETKNLGFMIYRQVGKGKELVSPNIIGGSYVRAGEEQTTGDNYTYFDPNGNGYDTYFIESLNTNGERQFSNAIYPQFISDLKTVAGRSALEMTENASNSNSIVQENKLQTSKGLKTLEENNQSAPDLPNQLWVAAQPGVRIGVRKEGIYRVTRAELQNAGFDVNSSPANWRLFLNGNEQSIIVEPSGNYIEFYGFGLDRLETDTQVYFLITGNQAGKRMETTTLPTTGTGFGFNFVQATKYKYRAFYISDVLNGDENNYFGSQVISTTTGVNINFNVPDIDCNSLSDPQLSCGARRLSIQVGVQGITQTSHTIRAELNGVEIGFITGSGFNLMTQNFKIPVAVAGRVNQGMNTLKLSTTGTPGDSSLLDSISINYKRKYRAMSNQLVFQTTDGRRTSIGGFTSQNVRAFDLLNSDEPAVIDAPVTTDGAEFKVDLPASAGRTIIAVEDSALSPVAWVVPNTISTLTTPNHNATFIIVTHKNFTAEADAWAALRIGQGMSTEVVQIDDIFDEFNYGASDSAAMKNFFQYAKDNWQTPPQYILLIGDGSYDFRNYEGLGYNSYIPTMMVDTVYMETGSDDALTDFNNDGLAEIAIGRIPARDGATVTQIMNKTISFELSVPNWTNRGALFAYDQSVGYDFGELSQRISQQLPANMPKTFHGRTYSTVVTDQQANQIELIDSMSTGKYFVNYSGHGSTGVWATPNYFGMNNMQTIQPTTAPTMPVMKNTNNFSIFTMLTCLNGYFIRNDNDSLAERLLKAKWFEEVMPGTYNVNQVGAAASWTSTGKTTPDVQEVMAARFLNQVTAGTIPRFGDLIRDSKSTVIGGRDVRLSWVLLGDPTMKLR